MTNADIIASSLKTLELSRSEADYLKKLIEQRVRKPEVLSILPESPTFYVFCPAQGPPTVSHGHFLGAQTEAIRLAGHNPNRLYQVLQVVGAYRLDL